MAVDIDQYPAVGDFFGPFFTIKFFNLTVEPTKVELTTEEFNEIRAGGLAQGGARFRALTSALVATLGGGPNATGLTLASAVEDIGNIRRDLLIDQHIPNIAASLTAESKAGSPYRFVATLTPNYEDGRAILNSRLFTYATVAEVSWGYTSLTGNPVVSAKHLYRNIYPKVTFGENITIVIEGYDIASDYAKHNTTRTTWPRSSYPSDWHIIEHLVTRNKPYQMSPGTYEEVAIAFPNSDLAKTQTEDISQRVTDQSFIQFLLRKSGGLTSAIIGTTFKIFDLVKPSPDNPGVVYTFKWRQALTGPRDIPVYSSTCNYLSSFFQPAASRGLLSLSYDDEGGSARATEVTPRDAENREPTPEPVGSAGRDVFQLLERGGTGGIVGADSSGNPVTAQPAGDTRDQTGAVIPHPASTEENAVDQRALTLAKEAGIMSAPRIKLKSPGVPHMFPGRIVALKGFTKIFDNYYIVHTVKHSISSSGYDMDVEVIRYSAATASTSAPPSNKQITPDATGGGDTPPEDGDGGPGARIAGLF